MSNRSYAAGMDILAKVMKDAADRAKDQEFDERLTEGHLHALIVDVLGGNEPLALAAQTAYLAMDARSKITLAPEKSIATLIQVHDRLYGAPQVKKKKIAADTAFQLDFAWGDTEEIEVTRTADDGTKLTIVSGGGEGG